MDRFVSKAAPARGRVQRRLRRLLMFAAVAVGALVLLLALARAVIDSELARAAWDVIDLGR